jgi:hypothetical protein
MEGRGPEWILEPARMLWRREKPVVPARNVNIDSEVVHPVA